MSTLTSRVTKVETEVEHINEALKKSEEETQRNRKSIHALRDQTHTSFIEQTQSHNDLKETLMEVVHQQKSQANDHKEMKDAVKNNTEAMQRLTGGVQVLKWIIGFFGSAFGLLEILERFKLYEVF